MANDRAPVLTLYGRFPTRSNRAQWALEELEVPYTFYEVDFSAGDADSPYFRSLNPAGKLPVLQDGDLVITESGAICNYLGAKYPDAGLTPAAGSPQRAVYDQWMFFVVSELEQPLWVKAKHKFALPRERRVEGLGETLAWEFRRAAEILAEGLGDKPFILGEQFTMADIMIAHTLGWARAADFGIPRQNLLDYADRTLGRPAVNRMFRRERLPFPAERQLH